MNDRINAFIDQITRICTGLPVYSRVDPETNRLCIVVVLNPSVDLADFYEHITLIALMHSVKGKAIFVKGGEFRLYEMSFVRGHGQLTLQPMA